MSLTTSLKALADFTEEESRRLREMKQAVYPDRPEGYPERRREWAAPDWGIQVTDGSGTLLSYTGVVERQATLDGGEVLIGGVGSIATHPSHRGKGYASLGMARALDFLHGRGVEFALLVCREELVSYYESLGWDLFSGTVLVTQFGAMETFTFNNVMVGDVNTTAPLEGVIDLQGPPW